MKANQSDRKWDVFISHAFEDKESFVRPLAVSLNQLGAEVWFDEFSLRLGDSLSRSIDQGLGNSRFGIVVISPNFIGKAWPERELSGLVSREIDQGRVIIPVWHGVTRKQVLDFSPTLADRLAVRTQNRTPQDIAIQVLCEIRPDLYEKHPRSELERLASGEAAKHLQQELERAKDELSEYKCCFCGAPLVERGGESVGPNSDHYGLHEIFECGYHAFDGYTERPCPSDPKFPHYEDYELEFHHNASGAQDSWLCFARPMTEMARKLSLQPGYGRTKEDAVRHLRERYDRYARKHGE
jgi:hypothetical protein